MKTSLTLLVLISCAVTAQLICAFVFAYASWFSHVATHLAYTILCKIQDLLSTYIHVHFYRALTFTEMNGNAKEILISLKVREFAPVLIIHFISDQKKTDI